MPCEKAKLTSDHVRSGDETGKKHPGAHTQRQGSDYLDKGEQVSPEVSSEGIILIKG